MFRLLVLIATLLAGLTSANAQSPVVPYVQGGPGYPPNQLAHIATNALNTSLLVKNTPGTLVGFNCTAITGAAAGYCIAYNANTVPGTGSLTGTSVLDVCYFDTTARGCSLAHLPNGALYTSGIVILVTSASTPFTYTTGTDTAFISADFN